MSKGKNNQRKNYNSSLTADDISSVFDDEFNPLPGVGFALNYVLNSWKKKEVHRIQHLDPNGIMNPSELKEIEDSQVDSVAGSLQPIVAKLGQVAVNSGQRQVWVNVKEMIDNDKRSPEEFRKNPLAKPLATLKNNPLLFLGGYSSRAVLQFGGIFPALQFRDNVLDKDTSIFAKTTATATIETAVGSFLEPKSLEKNLARDGHKLPTGLNFASTAGTLFFPYLVRNHFTWFAVNSNEENLLKKGGYGFVAGMLGAPFDTIANNAMKIARTEADFTMEETLKILGQSYKQMSKNPRAVALGAVCRGIGNGIAAPLLSSQVRDVVVEAQEHILASFQELYSTVVERNVAAKCKEEIKNPKTVVASNEYQKFVGDQKQQGK